MAVARSVALFVAAALFEIGGAWLVWQGIREHKGWIWIGAGVIALGLYGVVATFQSDDNFGRILAGVPGWRRRGQARGVLLSVRSRSVGLVRLSVRVRAGRGCGA
ncbi:hypothetical protein GCM10010358_82080 [Streptomyces minutiscleroticus]|uniref:Integral membrane protein n=1 Tax=Streptomyces minutiscleroticus TaxID=68238 RepID=A0A918P4G6_9ACTN|nr:YnfA family protein [Streptomyces minutiscleroticus]GGY18440.1 hypothetical protein GCM10010358_82080 [Streptomyces minutiscleroticus]